MSGETPVTSDIQIRQAEIDDLAAIFHLGEDVFTSQSFSNLYRTWDEYEVVGMFTSEPEYLYVADLDGRVIGFVIGSIIKKSRSAWNYGHLIWMAVHPDFAGCGVGGRLFDTFQNAMEEAGVRMLLVDTQADNDPAIRFFTAKGFVNPTDHVYMTLNMEKDKT